MSHVFWPYDEVSDDDYERKDGEPFASCRWGNGDVFIYGRYDPLDPEKHHCVVSLSKQEAWSLAQALIKELTFHMQESTDHGRHIQISYQAMQRAISDPGMTWQDFRKAVLGE